MELPPKVILKLPFDTAVAPEETEIPRRHFNASVFLAAASTAAQRWRLPGGLPTAEQAMCARMRHDDTRSEEGRSLRHRSRGYYTG